MFFAVESNKSTSPTFPFAVCRSVNSFNVLLDDGWTQYNSILYKGYCVDTPLATKVENGNFTAERGNYTILDFSDSFAIYHDTTRGFPLYYNSTCLTNHIWFIQDQKHKELYFDGLVKWKDEFVWEENTAGKVVYDSSKPRMSFDQTVDYTVNYLLDVCSKTETLGLPVKTPHSGGVDTTTLHCVYDYLGKEYEYIDRADNPHKLDLPFTAYWRNLYFGDGSPHFQLTGSWGDEGVLRNPGYCHWLLSADGISILDEVDKLEHCYMKGFIYRDYYNKLKKDPTPFSDYELAFNHYANNYFNDYQLWHYNQIVTFTPFRDLVFNTELMYADSDTILRQVLHADINRAVIKRLNPSKLDSLDKHKNKYLPEDFKP